MEKLKDDVQQKFTEIRNVLQMREKLLLRQADVILQQVGRVAIDPTESPTKLGRDVKFLVEQEEELFTTIRNFGRFHLENMNLQDCTYLKNEDYISPQLDHETMYKNINQQQQASEHDDETDLANVDREQSEAICVDFSRNKSLIEHNAQHMNESIVNITLQEAKELIKQARLKRDALIPPLNLEELDDELESSIAEAVSSLGHDPTTTSFTNPSDNDEEAAAATAKSTKESKKNSTGRFKPKITINNCNGTINLRNISSLTINCAAEDSISARIPCQMRQQQQQQQQQCNKSHNADCSDNGVVSSSSTAQNEQQHSQCCKKSDKSIDLQNSNENSPMSTTKTTTATTSGTVSNNSSSFSSRSQSSKSQNSGYKKSSQLNDKTSQNCTTTSVAYPYGMVEYDDDYDGMSQHAVSCDFYNRLLNEIKKSLRSKHTTADNNKHYVNMNVERTNQDEATTENDADNTLTTTATSDLNSNTPSQNSSTAQTNASQPTAGRRLILKNFENLRIVLEANSSDEESSDPKFHPVQIEQWLAEIISETDLEPMQNSDILEHSKIHSDKA